MNAYKVINHYGEEVLKLFELYQRLYENQQHGPPLGVVVHQVSDKRGPDAAEVYDGVPGLHDAKAAPVIARLYG